MKFLGARTKGSVNQTTVIIIGVFVVFFIGIFAIGIISAIIKNRTGAMASTASVNGFAGQQFQEVKKITITMTQYSPCIGDNTCDCPVDQGGDQNTSTGGIFKIVDGRLRWTRSDLNEDYVFAQPQSYNIIAQNQLDNMAVVVPGFNNNTPIFIRDVYGRGVHTNENYLDLFVPCSEFTNESKTVEVSIVDLTKPLNNSSFGPDVNGTYYPPLGGQKATSTNRSSHGDPGHGVFVASPFGDGFTDVSDGAIDFSAPGGTPIYAAFDGTIAHSVQIYQPKVKANGTRPYEKGAGILFLKSSDGNNGAIYAHIAFAQGVTNGTKVTKGQQIGTVASQCGSGQCVTFRSGPHLHFQMYINKIGQTKRQIMQLFPNAV